MSQYRGRNNVIPVVESIADPLLEDDVNFRSLLVEYETQRDDDEPAFFYHSDHLGGANWITTAEGSSVRSFVVGR